MKNVLLAILLASIFSNNINAQWHSRSCGVIDINQCTIEEFECMWNKASKIAHRGAITTIVGTSMVCVGGLMIGTGFIANSEWFAWNGMFLGVAGIFVDMIGVPVWIVGSGRKKSLKQAPTYQDLNSGSLNISPALGINQINHSHFLGMSISLNF